MLGLLISDLQRIVSNPRPHPCFNCLIDILIYTLVCATKNVYCVPGSVEGPGHKDEEDKVLP